MYRDDDKEGTAACYKPETERTDMSVKANRTALK